MLSPPWAPPACVSMGLLGGLHAEPSRLCPLCLGPLCVSFSLHAPVTGNSLLPKADSCLPAPDPGFPPGIPRCPLPIRWGLPRVAPFGAGLSPRAPSRTHFCSGRSQLFISAELHREAPGGPQGWDGGDPPLPGPGSNPAVEQQAGRGCRGGPLPACRRPSRDMSSICPASLPPAPTEPPA